MKMKIDPSVDFKDALYVENTYLPMRAEYLAVQQILEFAWLGLGMCGDKNQDGRLEFHELVEYYQYMHEMFRCDQDILEGLKILAKKFIELAGKKMYLNEQDLFQYKDILISRLCVEGLLRPSIAHLLKEDIALLLKMELARNKSVQCLIAEINLTLDILQSTARIDKSGEMLDYSNTISVYCTQPVCS